MSKQRGNYCKNIQKEIDDIMNQLQELSDLPLVRRTVLTNIKLNYLTQKLAFFVQSNNRLIEMESELRQKTEEHLGFISNIVFSLIGQIRKIEGVDTSEIDKKVEEAQKEIKKMKQVLNKHEKVVDDIIKAKEKKKKWMENNK